MTRHLRFTFILLCTGLATAVLADIEVNNAYIRGLPPGVANTAAYMKLINTGDEPLKLTGASSPVAGAVTLHNTMEHGGMLHMMHVDSATIPAHGELLLESGGMHLMLMELKENPRAGDEVELTLQFADGSSETLMVPVRSVLDEQDQ